MKPKDTRNYLNQAHPRFFEDMYKKYLGDSESVDYGWQKFFEGFELGRSQAPSAEAPFGQAKKEFRVLNLIDAYRSRGHLFTRTNPVRTRREYSPNLDIENFGLGEKDLSVRFQAGQEIGIGPATLAEIVSHLKETYCASIGAEYRFIREPEKVRWLQQRMESSRNRPRFPAEQKKQILSLLNRVVTLEKFLHTRFVGKKRFAISGGETLLPGLDALVRRGRELGAEEFVFGMSHRGRLNVLAHILGKPYEALFAEFKGKDYRDDLIIGDVKYHLGYSNRIQISPGKKVGLNLAPNPSHLEAVDAYVQGIARSKIDNKYRGRVDQLVPVLIHGDAAIAGQGVVYEVIQMSLLDGYHTGGTIHLVVNNQLGFTTNYLDGRSSTYCTDVAKVTLSPVFHVNADDVEAVVLASQMAIEYRQKFHTDVFVDLLGYRKYGHNEADEPRFTQPRLYKAIARHSNPHDIYFRKLEKEGIVTEVEKESMETAFWKKLQEHLEKAQHPIDGTSNPIEDECDHLQRIKDFDFEASPPTGIKKTDLSDLAKRIFTIPEKTGIFDKIRKLYDKRLKKFTIERACDWAMGEALAWGSLLREGVDIRLSGQDSERGTFAHRHGVLLVEDTEDEYVPLRHAGDALGRFEIYNSPLSEYGVLGFEFGYACANPDGLTLWEAQFGDFVNGAQVFIDEYLASSEAKWGKVNSLVLLLPHGFEGQGPDHSSARLERFLEICARNNLQVVCPSTPANFFHLMRRHVHWPFKVPLVVFTPKSLLRHPLCISPVSDFISGRFLPVIDDTAADPDRIRRILICTGKIFYELAGYREAEGIKDTAILRLEQLYPFPAKNLTAVLGRYQNAGEVWWVQEEPENMGAWGYLLRSQPHLPFGLIARRENSAAASGFYKVHLWEQEGIVTTAFGRMEGTHRGVSVRPGSKKKPTDLRRKKSKHLKI